MNVFIWIGIVLASIVLWRRTFRMFVYSSRTIDGFNVFMSGLSALLAFWIIGPFLLLGDALRVGNQDWESVARRLGGEPRGQKRRRKAQSLRAREAKVAQLEKELGMT